MRHHHPTAAGGSPGTAGPSSATGGSGTGFGGQGVALGWVDLFDSEASPDQAEDGTDPTFSPAAAETATLFAGDPTLGGGDAPSSVIAEAGAGALTAAAPTPSATGTLVSLADPAVLTGLVPLLAPSQPQQSGGDPVSTTVDQVVQGAAALSTYGVNGAGITIGIISDSFNTLGGAAADEADGALPAASMVHILQDSTTTATDEGRAMAQIIHSIAPDAQIDFYTSGESDASMATAITALQQAGAQIIVDDVSFFDEPFYQEDDSISNAINAAVADGVTYFTAATNAGDSYYESTFSPITATINGRSVTAANFGGPNGPSPYEEVTIPEGLETIINLQWAQPFATSQGIATGPGAAYSLSFDLFNSNKIFIGSLSANDVGSDPIQLGEFENNSSNTTFYIALVVNGGTVVPGQSFKIIMENDSNEPVSFAKGGTGSGDIFGHEMDPNAITVGAVPENNPSTIENFSSQGPGEYLYGPSGNLLATPIDTDKVNLVAPDGNSTSFPSSSGLDPFYGTSAAAPAAAAVGALVLQANSALNPSDIENLLTDTATPESASANVAGAGLVDALGAVGVAETLTFDENATNLTLLGTHLNDTFVGGPGNHTINGEGGTDTLDYAGATTAVSVNFTTGTAINGAGGTDSFTNIEAVEVSASVNTTITGTASETVTVDLASLNAGVTLALGSGAFALAGTCVVAGGTIETTSGGTLNLSGAIDGAGLVSGAITNTGLLEASGGTLALSGSITGGGSAMIVGAATLDLGLSDAEGVTYSGTGGDLDLAHPSTFGGVIAGLAVGDVIDLAGTSASAAVITGTTLSVTTSGGLLTYQLAAALPGDSFTISGDGAGGSDLTLSSSAPSYALASAKINTASPVNFGNLRQGAAASAALSVTNNATAPAEALDASIAGTTGMATGSGTISLLGAGLTSTTGITVGLSTATAGAESGSVTVGFGSDGSTTDGHGVTALASQTVQVEANVYREAVGSVAGVAPLVVHVGAAGTVALSVTNKAAGDGFSEALIGTIAATSGGVSAGGTTGDIAAQATNTGLTVGFSTGAAGTVSGSVTVGFVSDGSIDGAGQTAIGQQVVSVAATVDNYAVAAFEELSGGGTFTVNGNAYTLNLGTLSESAGSVTIDLGAFNNAAGPVDLLSGSFATSGSSAFTLAGFGSFSGLGAGAADTAPIVTMSLSTGGTFSETITLSATGSNSSGYSAAVATKTLTITGTVQGTALAAAKINTASPVNFGNLRQGAAASAALSVTNNATAPAEALDASIAGTTGMATGSGTISLLGAGLTSTNGITVGLSTGTAGAESGSVTVGFGSDGSTTDGHGVTALASQTVQVEANVYREAVGSVASVAPLVVHVGAAGTVALSVTNKATGDGFSEALIGTIAATSGGVSAGGTTGDIAAQATNTGLTVGFSTGAAGTVSGSVTVGFVSDGSIDGAGQTAVGQQVVSVAATVDNYAVAAFEELSGGGTFAVNGNAYTLNLGTLSESAGSVTIDLGAFNNAAGPVDLLSGSFATSGSSAFTLAGFGSFSGLGAGAPDTAPSVTLSLGNGGTFSETITLSATGSNSSGYSAAVATKTLTITGTVQGTALAAAKINTASPVNFGNLRQGAAASAALSVTNSATAPAEALDASIAGTTGMATGSGTISLLGAGLTSTTGITVGLSTATAGAESGSVTVGFGSDGSTTDGHGVTALASQTVQVEANVYREAVGSVAGVAPLVVHVGAAGTVALSVTNKAAGDGFSEALIGTIAATSGGVSAGGTTGDIAAQATNTGLTVGFSTGAAGTVSGSVTVGFVSDGSIDGAGQTAIGQQVVSVNATVDNYAVAAFEELSGGGTFAVNGNAYTLNLGTLSESAGSVTIDLGAFNNAAGPVDLLSGSFATSGSSAFTLAGFGSFSGLGAGAADTAPSVTLSLGNGGTFSETITLSATGSNSSGYSAAVATKTLTITGTVQSSAHIWQGTSSSNLSGGWDIAADWSPDTVPGAGDVAEILAAGSYTVTSSVSTTVGSLDNAATGAMLSITNGSQFIIAGGGSSTNAGTLSLAAGATLTVQGGTITNSGGTIAAAGAGAVVALAGATVSGGTVSTAAAGASGGVIEAMSGLTSTLSGVSLVDNGLIEALGGSTLVLANVTETSASANGVIEANGGTVELTGATVTGTLMTSSGGTIVAVGAGNLLITGATMASGSTLTVSDGATLASEGTITNNGVIALDATGDATDLVVATSTTLQGTGTIALSSGSGNAIVSAGTAVSLTNNAETIAGVGTLGDSHLSLSNGANGVIDANGAAALAIDAGSAVNSGLLEATASGGLTISGNVINTNNGTIAANGGNVTITGNLTTNQNTASSGNDTIAGATLDIGGRVAAGQTVTFAASSTGALMLGLAQSFAGTVAGLASGDAIDLADFAFSGSPTIASVTGTGAAGSVTTLTVSDGALTAKIGLFNQTASQMPASAAGYVLASDLNGATPGTLLTLAAHA